MSARLRYAWGTFRAFLRWNLPLRRETACHLIDDGCETYYQMLDRRINYLMETLTVSLAAAGLDPESAEIRQAGDPPGPARVTQRDLDDAVAELIRRAREDAGGDR